MEMREPGMMSIVVFLCISVIAFMLFILVTIFTLMQRSQNKRPLFRQRQFGYMIAGMVCILGGLIGAAGMNMVRDREMLTRFDDYISGILFAAAFILYFLIGYLWKKFLKD